MAVPTSLTFVLVLLFAATAHAQTGPGADAAAAYRTLVRHIDPYAATDQDLAAFTAGLAPQLSCWFGRANVARTQTGLRDGDSAGIAELTVLRDAADDVTLLDRGWYGRSDTPSAFHEKLVRLRRTAGHWLVVAESSATPTHGCSADDTVTIPPESGRFAECRRNVPPVVRMMVADGCADGGGNGCEITLSDAFAAAPSCLFGSWFDWSQPHAVPTSIRSVQWTSLPQRDTAGTGPRPAPVVGYGDVDGDGSEDAVLAYPGESPGLVVLGLKSGQLYELGNAFFQSVGRQGCSATIQSVRVSAHGIVVAYSNAVYGPPTSDASQCGALHRHSATIRREGLRLPTDYRAE